MIVNLTLLNNVSIHELHWYKQTSKPINKEKGKLNRKVTKYGRNNGIRKPALHATIDIIDTGKDHPSMLKIIKFETRKFTLQATFYLQKVK